MVSVVTQVLEPLLVVTTQEGEPSLRMPLSIKEKQDYIQAIDTIVAKGISHCKACSIVGLHRVYYAHFKKVTQKVDKLEKDDAFVAHETANQEFGTYTDRRHYSCQKSMDG
jgi:hypothetical protein